MDFIKYVLLLLLNTSLIIGASYLVNLLFTRKEKDKDFDYKKLEDEHFNDLI